MSLNPLNLPTLSHSPTPQETKRALDAIRAYFYALQKAGGLVTPTDLAKSGIGQIGSDGGLLPVTGEDGEVVFPVPPAPLNLTVTGAFNLILLQWDNQSFAGKSITEVWRANVDDFGEAVNIGDTGAYMYADTPPDSALSTDYYYWVRHVNLNGVEGPLNSASGTQGRTADEPEYLLELLIDSKWKASTARALNFLGYPSKPNGYAYKVIVAGTSGATEPTWPTILTQTVVDGTITWRCEAAVPLTPPFEMGLVNGIIRTVIKALWIGDATITNAMIKNLAADKILAGTITAALTIIAPIISGGMINLGNFTGYAWPASGGTGAHLSASGLLLGNSNDGKYFQVQAGGNVYAPQFSIVNGNATFSGDLSANIVNASHINTNSITTEKINGEAVTQIVAVEYMPSTSETGYIAAVTINSVVGGKVALWFKFFGSVSFEGQSFYVQIRRGTGVVLRSFTVSYSSTGLNVNSSLVDVPGAGSITYYIYKEPISSGNSYKVAGYGLTAINAKR